MSAKVLAERALEAGIQQVVFDRGGYKYHGRVKALADASREGWSCISDRWLVSMCGGQLLSVNRPTGGNMARTERETWV